MAKKAKKRVAKAKKAKRTAKRKTAQKTAKKTMSRKAKKRPAARKRRSKPQGIGDQVSHAMHGVMDTVTETVALRDKMGRRGGPEDV